jgi:hypothetical protein
MRYLYFFSGLALGVSLVMTGVSPALGQNDVAANERLHFNPPENDLQLASSNDIPLQMTSDPVLQVIVDWKAADGTTPEGSEEKEGMINYGADGQAVIAVHPPVLGRASLTIRVDFKDGRYAVDSADVNVGLPKRKPKTFEVSDGRENAAVTVLQMDLDQNRIKRLGGVATYSGYKYPVSIAAANLKFNVKPQSGQSPIEVDPRTGLVTARSQGQALVDVRFGGRDRAVCVVVSKDAGEPNSASCAGASK